MERDSYYKRLGTTAKASQARIIYRYYEQVKKFPKEVDLETNRRIEEAFQVLGSAEKRMAYDRIRKYKYNVKDLMLHGLRFLGEDDVTSKTHMTAALMLEPIDHSTVLFGVSHLSKFAIEQERITDFIERYETLILNQDRHLKHQLLKYLSAVYSFSDDEDRGFDISSEYVKHLKSPTADDAPVLLWYFDLLLQRNQTKDILKVHKLLKELLPTLPDDEFTDHLYDQLTEMFTTYYQLGLFTYGCYVQELQLAMIPDKPALRDGLKDMKALAQLEKDYERAMIDSKINMSVVLDLTRLLFKGHERKKMLEDELFEQGYIYELAIEAEADLHAAGLMRIKKSYPRLYRAYKDVFDREISRFTEHLSREEKRRLMKLT
ncbi:hypothetical protein GCM10012290_16150 [Halolactibacillus alkaliphilus]|uniref:J domain-containing protein n=1 Tax=Halolactibacillus alkaliphilus TaxID=442899 RepID=A0A511X1S8_9BACI|nr:hypothetical protein [Halolactibacillus alkaliphilus]GEN56871.1 hypothetical protein HAL01_13350 [Halolactibacillus alkaliphilus]GGN71361.1 hypothetical protein GCM10012290_16150 [Halolactibacillus alkaliphilus]SFO82453.1 hypothetical protein SAMN05720591_11438 [Halolactibacillus alkaliphilus]